MNTTIKAIAIAFTATLTAGTAAHSQTLDDMTCYKTKANSTFSFAQIDIAALDPTISDNESCTLKKKPTKVCVPSSAEVTETDGERWSTAGDELSNYYVCYKVKCAESGSPDMRKADQFGTHDLVRPRTSEICVPAMLGCGPSVEPAEQAGMTLAHNDVRASVPGTTEPLPALKWDSCMEAGAASYASQCRFAHASSSERGGAGENLYAVSSPGIVTAAQVANTWASERYLYEYPSGTCSGRTCGHYTQMVWRETLNLGCAKQVCNSGNPFGTSGPWELWVCRYDPAGNRSGELPY